MHLPVKQAEVELQILLISSKYRLNSDDILRVRELARQGDLEWRSIFSLARRHNVFPRVWSNIASAVPEVVPEHSGMTDIILCEEVAEQLLIAHAKRPKRYLPGGSGFNIIRNDVAISLAAELSGGLARSADFKDIFVVDDEITLIMVMDLVAMRKLRDKKSFVNSPDVWSRAQGMKQVWVVQE